MTPVDHAGSRPSTMGRPDPLHRLPDHIPSNRRPTSPKPQIPTAALTAAEAEVGPIDVPSARTTAEHLLCRRQPRPPANSSASSSSTPPSATSPPADHPDPHRKRRTPEPTTVGSGVSDVLTAGFSQPFLATIFPCCTTRESAASICSSAFLDQHPKTFEEPTVLAGGRPRQVRSRREVCECVIAMAIATAAAYGCLDEGQAVA
jgi:hypothetical protein